MIPAPPDGCPACLTATARAHSARSVDGSVHAAYCCPECGHRWTTSWLASALAASPEHPNRRTA